MIFNSRFIASVLILCALSSCKKPSSPVEVDENDTKEEYGPVVDNISGSDIFQKCNVFGLVTDGTEGIASVAVTDGERVSVTDQNGVYQFPSSVRSRLVYISLPTGYELPQSQNGAPAFWHKDAIVHGKTNRRDFVLTKAIDRNDESWTLVGIGDPQSSSESATQTFKSETIPALSATAKKYPGTWAVTLGDIVQDNYDQFAPMQAALASLGLPQNGGMPVFNCIGNHDHDYNFATGSDWKTTKTYMDNFGPTDYSFNRGMVHVVVMDNVIVTGKGNKTCTYVGGFTKEQYEWLKADLATVKDRKDKVVFICVHIPFRAGTATGADGFNKDRYYEQSLELLTEFREAHIISGHTHSQINYVHKGYTCRGGMPIYEHVMATACGAWWTTTSDKNGNPAGYTLFNIKGNSVDGWVSKGSLYNENFQLRVYDGNASYGSVYRLNWTTTSQTGGSRSLAVKGNKALEGCFVAQVWDDDDTLWSVNFYQGGAKKGSFTRLQDGGAMNVAYNAYVLNEVRPDAQSYFIQNSISHLWYYKPVSGKPASEKDWEIVASYKSPATGKLHKYSCNTLTTDFSTFNIR